MESKSATINESITEATSVLMTGLNGSNAMSHEARQLFSYVAALGLDPVAYAHTFLASLGLNADAPAPNRVAGKTMFADFKSQVKNLKIDLG